MKNGKIKNLSYIITTILIIISFLLLHYIEFETEYIFNMFRFILIRFFRINPHTNINIDLIIFFIIFGYIFLHFKFQRNKNFFIMNQILLMIYLILNIYPITFGKYKLLNTSSIICFLINLIVIIILNLMNIYRIKHLKL